MNYSLRNAESDDYVVVYPWLAADATGLQWTGAHTAPVRRATDLEYQVLDAAGHGSVLLADGVLLAFLQCQPPESGSMHLLRALVAPQVTDMAQARALLAELITQAALTHEARALTAEVLTHDVPARNLFSALGFQGVLDVSDRQVLYMRRMVRRSSAPA